MKQINGSPTLVNIGPVRLSYLSVFKPRKSAKDDGSEEYSVMLLLPKEASEFSPDPRAEINGAATAVKAALSAKFGDAAPKVFKNCMKDGDKEVNEDTGAAKYPGFWYIRASCKPEYPPILVDGQGRRVPTNAPWTSGDWGIVQVNFFGYDNKSKGVSAGLRGIQFLYKDEPLGGDAAASPDAIASSFDVVDNAHAPVASGPAHYGDQGSGGWQPDDNDDPFADS